MTKLNMTPAQARVLQAVVDGAATRVDQDGQQTAEQLGGITRRQLVQQL